MSCCAPPHRPAFPGRYFRRGLSLMALVVAVGRLAASTQPDAVPFDVVIRGGTVLDGTGAPGFVADVGVRRGHIAAIGDLAAAAALRDIDARALLVTPGFINIHSHAAPGALPTAVNMLTQGVTTEIVNADGVSPSSRRGGSSLLDASTAGAHNLTEQLATLQAGGLALNVGGYIGFNSTWQDVMGDDDRRPSADDVRRMRALVDQGLREGAWGVSSGLDYKPAYYAQTEEVIRVVEVARPWRTNFTNHHRVTPESGYSSRAGIVETLVIGQKAGLAPVVTHMKAEGVEQGTAAALLATIAETTRRGHYAAADAYPYLAGQTGLSSLILPGWALAGGPEAALARFKDPATRARIVREAEATMAARFGVPQGVYLPKTQQELTTVMQEMGVSGGEAVLRILEASGDPGAILRFGAEADLVRILADPVTSMACDCGATLETRIHPRFFGSFPRVLGRYVREQRILTWEQAVRKMTGLPAATIGLVDRGLLAVGMAADITVFDPRTIVDRATFESPAVLSEGVRAVLVNGTVALDRGIATGVAGGRTLTRTAAMPSRPLTLDVSRRLSVDAAVDGLRVVATLTQGPLDRIPRGTLTLRKPGASAAPMTASLGTLQTAPGWASLTGVAGGRAFTLIVDAADPRGPAGRATIVLAMEGAPIRTGIVPSRSVTLSP